MSAPCIAREIWDRCRAGLDLSTAQGRGELDGRMRRELAGMDCAIRRDHVAETLRRMRALAIEAAIDAHMRPALVARVEALEARVAWLEARLGEGAPPPAPRPPREITSIRRDVQ